MVYNLFLKCISYCRYTGATPVTWLLLKSEWFQDEKLIQLFQTLHRDEDVTTPTPLPLIEKKQHQLLFGAALNAKFADLNIICVNCVIVIESKLFTTKALENNVRAPF